MMSLKYAILGLLSWQPFTGYDLKKIFTDFTLFYWSGNNNQIYTTLVQLLKEEQVTYEVTYQEKYPPKKTYSITDQGLAELRQWVLSNPSPPELRNTFLIQLAWAHQLAPEELDQLLAKYEYEVQMQLLMQQEKKRRGVHTPNRTPREVYLWEMITQNIIGAYENELTWVQKLRRELPDKSL